MKYRIHDTKTGNYLAGKYETVQEAKEAIKALAHESFGPYAEDVSLEKLKAREDRFEVIGVLGEYPEETYRHLADIKKSLRDRAYNTKENSEHFSGRVYLNGGNICVDIGLEELKVIAYDADLATGRGDTWEIVHRALESSGWNSYKWLLAENEAKRKEERDPWDFFDSVEDLSDQDWRFIPEE